MFRQDAKHSPFKAALPVMGVTFTIGAEDTNVKKVTLQLNDADGLAIKHRAHVKAYLASDANGDALAAAPTVAIATHGLLRRGVDLAGITALTDSSAGSANNTVEAMADIATAGDATPSAAQVDTAVNAVLAKIRNNFADVAAKVNEVLAAGQASFVLVSEVTGLIDINITKTGAATYYLVVELPDGSLAVSSVITFV